MRKDVSSNLLLGGIVDGFVIPPHPRGIELEGELVIISHSLLKSSERSFTKPISLIHKGTTGLIYPMSRFQPNQNF